MTTIILAVTLAVTGFLFLLNCGFAYVFRHRRRREMLSYLAACTVELAFFAFALLLNLRLLRGLPLHLPHGFPLSRTEFGATIAVAVGLFPAAYWHRTSPSSLRERLAQDAKVIKERETAVPASSDTPSSWMN